MSKYHFSNMPNEGLKEAYHGLNKVLGVFSGHYQSLVFSPSEDVYYIGSAIEKIREIIKEASEEIESRKPKPVLPPSEIHY